MIGYIIALVSGPKKVLDKVMYISYVIVEEMVAKETAGEKNWSRKPKRETDTSGTETEKGKEEQSEIARCYPS